MYIRRQNLDWPASQTRTNDDGGVLHGPILTTTDSARFKKVVLQTAPYDQEVSWSKSDALGVRPISPSTFELRVAISNHGDQPARGTSLIIVVWGAQPTQVGYFNQPVIESIGGTNPTDPAQTGQIVEPIIIDIRAINYGGNAEVIADTSEITHIYAIVFDIPFDLPDKICSDFCLSARAGRKFFGPSNMNPCRLSRQMACTPFNNEQAFSVNGGNIQHNLNGMIEVFMNEFTTNSGAGFGYISSAGGTIEMLPNIRALPLRTPYAFNGVIPSGSLVFYISQSGQVLPSTNPHYARSVAIANNTGDLLTIAWNDTGDDIDNDYTMNIVHR